MTKDTPRIPDAPPLALMLASPSRRKYRRWSLGLTLLASAAVAGISWLYPESASIWLVLAALVTLIYPFLSAYQDASVIGMLRFGRSLDEILTTKTPSAQWIDSVTSFSFGATLESSLSLSTMVAALMLVHEHQGGHWQPGDILRVSALWFLACLVINVASCNLFLLCAVCDRIDMDSPIGVAWGMTALLAGLYGLANGGQLGYGLMAFALFCAVMACRQLALEWLERGDSTPPIPTGMRRPSSNGSQLPFNENPIVVRESARLARKLAGGGVLTVFLYHHGLFFLTLALFAFFLPTHILEIAWYAFPIFFLVQPVMASMSVSTSLVEERERRTLESLALTQMTAEEFVDGWASFGWRYRVSELLLMVLYTSLIALETHNAACLAIIPSYLWLLGACFSAAYLGVLASTTARSRAQAGSFSLGYCGLMLLVLGACSYLGQWSDNLLLLVAVAAFAYLVRRRALQKVHT